VPDWKPISVAEVAWNQLFGTGHMSHHEMGLMMPIEWS